MGNPQSKILIIDDDRELCEEMREILVDDGYHVEVCSSGMQGLSLLSWGHYDVLLLDLKLPDIPGTDVLRFLKQKKCRTRVILISGNPSIITLQVKGDSQEPSEEEKLFRMADGMFSKPCDIEKLLETLRKTAGPSSA
jgi:DNA-binding response OmpR family regulator